MGGSPKTERELPIAELVVGKRARKNLGDLGSLKRSISELGLLQAVVVDSDRHLIAGRRRMVACQELGWDRIRVFVAQDLDGAAKALRAERDENTCREPLLPTEAVELGERLEKLERPKAKERQAQAGPAEGKGAKRTGSGNFPEALGRSRDQVGEALGMSGKTYEKAKAVVAAAKEDPEQFGDLAEQMDSTGKVDGAYRQLKQRRERAAKEQAAAKRIAKAKTIDEALGAAKFATIVVDPPWDWDDEGDVNQLGRAKPTYGAMSFDELLRFPLGERADKDSHLYLWITNRSLPKGFALIEAWGYRYITCLTWCKPSIGMGNYFRGSTEHVLFAVRGSLALKRKDVGTWFVAPRGKKHSAKPNELYAIAESCSPGPYLDVFARGQRKGWVCWGGECDV